MQERVSEDSVSAHSDGRVLAEVRLAATLSLQKERSQLPRLRCGQIGEGTPGGAGALAIFVGSSTMNG